MNLRKLILPILAVSLMVSCNQEEVIPSEKAEFSISSAILPMTKTPTFDPSGAGKFNDGDKNTLFFHTAQNENLLTFEYTYGKTYYWIDLGLPQNTANCRLSACYPTVTTSSPMNFEWNVTTQENPDFISSKPVQVNIENPSPIQLTFYHLMHQLNVSLKADGTSMTQGALSDAKITLKQFLPTASINLYEGKATGSKGQSSQLAQSGDNARFIIPAQKIGNIQIEIQIGDRKVTYRLSECKVNGQPLTQLESGKSFNLTINVSKDSFSIDGQQISGWQDQGSVEDSIII